MSTAPRQVLQIVRTDRGEDADAGTNGARLPEAHEGTRLVFDDVSSDELLDRIFSTDVVLVW